MGMGQDLSTLGFLKAQSFGRSQPKGNSSTFRELPQLHLFKEAIQRMLVDLRSWELTFPENKFPLSAHK